MKYKVHMFPIQKNILKNEVPTYAKYFVTKNLNIPATPKRNNEGTLSSIFKLKLNMTDTSLKTYGSNKYLKKRYEERESDLSKLKSAFDYKNFVKSIFSSKKTKFPNETFSNFKTPSSHFNSDESKRKMKTEEKIKITQPSEAFKSPINVKNQPKVYFGSFKDIMNKKGRSLHINAKKTDNFQNSDCSFEGLMNSNEEKMLVEPNSKEGK